MYITSTASNANPLSTTPLHIEPNPIIRNESLVLISPSVNVAPISLKSLASENSKTKPLDKSEFSVKFSATTSEKLYL